MVDIKGAGNAQTVTPADAIRLWISFIHGFLDFCLFGGPNLLYLSYPSFTCVQFNEFLFEYHLGDVARGLASLTASENRRYPEGK